MKDHQKMFFKDLSQRGFFKRSLAKKNFLEDLSFFLSPHSSWFSLLGASAGTSLPHQCRSPLNVFCMKHLYLCFCFNLYLCFALNCIYVFALICICVYICIVLLFAFVFINIRVTKFCIFYALLGDTPLGHIFFPIDR